VVVNATYGYIKTIRANAVQPAQPLPVDSVGPFELTLFLRNELPRSDILGNGRIQIEIQPQLTLPDSALYGSLRCYFFGDLAAKTITWDVATAGKTIVTIDTPESLPFKFSEIPISVTTVGGSTGTNGIKINSFVQRYTFVIQFYINNASTPSEVFFTSFVPAPV
jgi:hypothetical protein